MTWTRRWIKLHIEVLDDPKMGKMPDWLWRRTVELFLLAGENGNDGELQPVADMAWRLRTTEEKLLEALQAISQVGVAERLANGNWKIVNFVKRNDADTSTERVEAFRKRTRNDVVTKRCLDKSRGEEIRVEENAPPPLSFSPSIQAERIFQAVTLWPTFPSSEREDAIEIIQNLQPKHGDGLVEYLKPFFLEFKRRYPNSTRCFWLTDWAVAGSIPDPKKPPQYRNGKDRPLTSEEKGRLLAAQLRSKGTKGVNE